MLENRIEEGMTGGTVRGILNGALEKLEEAETPVSVISGGVVAGQFVTGFSADGHKIQVNKSVETAVSVSGGAAESGKYVTAISANGHAISVSKGSITETSVSVIDGTETAGQVVTGISADGHKITVKKSTETPVAVSGGGAESGKYVTAISANGHGISVTKGTVNETSVSIINGGVTAGQVVTGISASGHNITVTKGTMSAANFPVYRAGVLLGNWTTGWRHEDIEDETDGDVYHRGRLNTLVNNNIEPSNSPVGLDLFDNEIEVAFESELNQVLQKPTNVYILPEDAIEGTLSVYDKSVLLVPKRDYSFLDKRYIVLENIVPFIVVSYMTENPKLIID